MFGDADYEAEVEHWDDTRTLFMELLIPSGGTNQDETSSEGLGGPASPSLISHLENVSARYPFSELEASLLEFSSALSASIAPPVLTQLERGHLDGMSPQETQEFLLGCGIHLTDSL
jgi:hypothetical protein